MKRLYFLFVCLSMTSLALCASAKYVGGDISLLTKYEQHGAIYYNENGTRITNMLDYLKTTGMNAMRVRLFVDPSKANAEDQGEGVCQDLPYVMALGQRIKAAGFNLLLDIHYSDTWTDPGQHSTPSSWTVTSALADSVYSYTRRVLSAMITAGAQPDFVQVGNEVTYGMLWPTGHCYPSGAGYGSGSFANFANYLMQGIRACREVCPAAKIVVHTELGRTSNVTAFYNSLASYTTDYDIIGLSYYPFWHGDLAYLKSTLSTLQNTFPTKEIHIVETGYFNNSGVDHTKLDYDTSGTWPFTSKGQAAFLTDLVTTLASYKNVKGLYYWQPEECGNGADTNGNNRVMSGWDNRGFWELSWKSGNHAMKGGKSVAAMQNFISQDGPTPTETDITSQFENMDFENGESNIGWSINTDQNWGMIGVFAPDQWMSSLVGGNWLFKTWVNTGSTLTAGNILYQSKDNMPAGTYTITAIVHTDYNGIRLFANNDTKVVTASSAWGTAYEVSVSTTLTEPGTLTFGLTLPTAPTSTNEINLYADNFTVKQAITTEIRKGEGSDYWYTLDGRKVSNGQLSKGIYINNGKKIVVK